MHLSRVLVCVCAHADPGLGRGASEEGVQCSLRNLWSHLCFCFCFLFFNYRMFYLHLSSF